MAKFIPPDMVKKAKEVDAYSFLVAHAPHKLVRVSGKFYCTKEHDSMRINVVKGTWFWSSRKIGGPDAVSYLQKVEGYTFQEAVSTVLGLNQEELSKATKYVEEVKKAIPQDKTLKLPCRSYDDSRMKNYLVSDRNIDPEVVNFCIRNNLIYESFPTHNVVFVGYDDSDKTAKYGCQRSLGTGPDGKRFFGECSGSDKSFSFKIDASYDSENNCELHIFEGAIDALSYATIKKIQGENWRTFNYLALGGVAKSTSKEASPLPKNLQNFLNSHEIVLVYLHLDNDEAGRSATASLTPTLQNLGYEVIDRPSPVGKDINDAIPKFKEWAKTHKELIQERQIKNFSQRN